MIKDFWAITTDALDFLMTEIRSKSKDSGGAEKPGSISRDSIAVIPVSGILSKEGVFSFWSGRKLAQGYRDIKAMVQAASEDKGVKAIVLKIDSPGGSVDGCKELADFISATGREKPVYAFADGQATSAAYWIASTAKHIAAPETATLGSIGVRTLHADWSAWNEKAGIKYTHITAGDFKAAGNEDSPLDEESLNYIQSQLESLWNIFTRDVAQNRNLEQQSVKDQQAKVYLAEEAKTLGLIDAITPDIDAYINWIIESEGIRMDRIELKAKHPALFDEIWKEAKTEAESSIDEKIKAASENVILLAGAVADTEVSDKIRQLHSAGIDAKQAEAMKNIFGTAAPASSNADSESRKEILDAIKAATPGVVSGDPAKTADGDFDSLVKAEMAAGKSKVEAMKAVQKAHPDLHEKWILAQQGGR